MWTCGYCGAANPADTLECLRCERLDPNATPEELDAWRAAMHSEAEMERRHLRSKPRRPWRGAAVIVAVIAAAPLIWSVALYRRAAAEAGRFDRAAACDSGGVPGTPSPPCHSEPLQVTGGYSDGFMEVVPRRSVAHRWVWLSFTVNLVDADGRQLSAGVLDQPTLNLVGDEPRVTAVEYGGKIVALSGPAGYFETVDNPDVVRSDTGSDVLHGILFVGLLGGVYVLMEASGRIAKRSIRRHGGR